MASAVAEAGPQVQPTGADPSTDPLRSSKLLARGGYVVVPQLFSRSALLLMFDEARRHFSKATEERRDGPATEDWRGGLPPRRMLCGGGGPVQDQLYGAPALQALLSEWVGVTVWPSNNRASYSYYCREGDYLDVHRDVDFCDLSVIVVVSDNTGADEPGGELVLYPDRIDEPLSAIRDHPDRGAVSLKLAPGQTLVIAGGLVPHKVRPVRRGQSRITAPMCFQTFDLRRTVDERWRQSPSSDGQFPAPRRAAPWW